MRPSAWGDGTCRLHRALKTWEQSVADSRLGLRPRGTGWRSLRSRLALPRPILGPLPRDDFFKVECAARFGSVANGERVASFEDFEAVVAEDHRPMDLEHARIGEDFL